MAKEFWVYILLCSNGTYYTGYTTDLGRRYQEHLAGSLKCKYTRSFKPLSLAQGWRVESKSQALKLERFIKRLSRAEKVFLIKQPEALEKRFPF